MRTPGTRDQTVDPVISEGVTPALELQQNFPTKCLNQCVSMTKRTPLMFGAKVL